MTQTPAPRPPGRPSTLTPETIARLCAALQACHTRATAAALAGISESTFHAWMAAASLPDAEPMFLEFSEAIKIAEIAGEDALLATIRAAAARGTWVAAAWILERRHPDKWGKKFKAELSLETAKVERSRVERDIEEAEHSAETTTRIAGYARRGIPFSEWPAADQEASGFALKP